jgi:hypothetical protein
LAKTTTSTSPSIILSMHSPVNLSTCPPTIFRLFLGYFSTILRPFFDYPSTILRPFCSCHQTRNATCGNSHTTRACQSRTCCENHNDDYQEGCGHHIISAILQPFYDYSSAILLAILWLFFQSWTQRANTAPSKSTTTKATVTKPVGQGKCGPRGHQEEGSRSHSQTHSRRRCQGHSHQKDAGD